VEPDVEKNACCHTRLAPEYDACMAKHAGNAWVRGAFRHVVEQIVAPGSLLLDFGCGTGTDSLWYAQRGYRVLAYDNAPGMMAAVRRSIVAPVLALGIFLIHGSVDVFLMTTPIYFGFWILLGQANENQIRADGGDSPELQVEGSRFNARAHAS